VSSSGPAATIILGCDPEVVLNIYEDANNGSLVFILDQPDGADPVDIDGIFFDLNSDSAVEALEVFPFVDTAQVTGLQNSPDAVDTLANGAEVNDTYDVGVQFGTEPGSTTGEYADVGFTIFTEDGTPLTIDDVDLSNIAVVVDSDTDQGMALLPQDGDADAEPVKVDFEALEAGTIVSTQFDGVTVTAQRAGDSASSDNDAMIFDTSNPTGGDYDLGYADRGNVLIISEDGDGNDPDDNAHGGTFEFAFDAPSNVESLTLLDIENNDSSISAYDADGNLLAQVAVPYTGNNGAAEVALNIDGVSTLVVDIAGSGAVDDLCFTPEGGECQYLLGPGTPECQVVLAEDFNAIHDPDDSAAIVSDAGWDVRGDELVTDGSNDGQLVFAAVSASDPVELSFDVRSINAHEFEEDGCNADSLRVEVNIDGQGWVLLDEFIVDEHSNTLVGSETGQTFGDGGATLTYSGGVLDTATDSVQFRFDSDISYHNEQVAIDNVQVTTCPDGADPVCTLPLPVTVMDEDFDHIHDPDDSAVIESDAHWDVENDQLHTDGCEDGRLVFEEIWTSNPVEFNFDIHAINASKFEESGCYEDTLKVEVNIDGQGWVLLDEFRVDEATDTFTGSVTGQTFSEDSTELTYSGGVLDTATHSVQFRFDSDISASDEQIRIDNVEVVEFQQACQVEEQEQPEDEDDMHDCDFW